MSHLPLISAFIPWNTAPPFLSCNAIMELSAAKFLGKFHSQKEVANVLKRANLGSNSQCVSTYAPLTVRRHVSVLLGGFVHFVTRLVWIPCDCSVSCARAEADMHTRLSGSVGGLFCCPICCGIFGPIYALLAKNATCERDNEKKFTWEWDPCKSRGQLLLYSHK